jgi:hypothetical protein
MTGISQVQRDRTTNAILAACRDKALSMDEIILAVSSYLPMRYQKDACQRHIKQLKDQGKIKRTGRLLIEGGGWAPLYRTVPVKP